MNCRLMLAPYSLGDSFTHALRFTVALRQSWVWGSEWEKLNELVGFDEGGDFYLNFMFITEAFGVLSVTNTLN